MSDERAPITFREWKDALAAEPWAAGIKEQAARDIIGFLRHCKVLHSPACIAVAKAYLADTEGQARSGDASSGWTGFFVVNCDRPSHVLNS